MILEVFEHALMITAFVAVMLLLIEYITVQTQGLWSRMLQKSAWKQIILAAFLGILPGCMGSFIAVSLYAHKVINFAALVTVMIATSGDEIFVMFSMIPQTGFLIIALLFGIAVIAGFLVHLVFKDKTFMVLKENHLKFHHYDPECKCFDRQNFIPQLQKISFQRAILLTVGFLFLIFLVSGEIGPDEWNWKRITFLITALIGLFIIITVPDHFLSEHLWQHTIKKHVPKIFLWTFGAFLFIHLLEHHIFPGETELKSIAEQYQWLLLLIAVAIGIIPESGPHIVFITLFANGTIPFSILLANSIVQDGHGAIPLFAESKRSFLFMKLANVIFGLLAGLLGWYANW